MSTLQVANLWFESSGSQRIFATSNTLIRISSNGGIQIPAGTTAGRPINEVGIIRYNTDTGLLEYGDSSSWLSIPTTLSPSNGWANIVGTAGNNYASILIANNSAAINSYATVMDTAGNNYTNSVGLAGNNYTNSVGLAGNNYASVLIANNSAAINSYATVMDTAGNNYTNYVGVSGNNYASILIANNSAAINSYALTTATSIGTAGNNYTSATYYAKSGGTISGDVTVTGNLTISGITTYANTQHLYIGDNILTLNADLPAAVAPTENAGLSINRGSSANASLEWNESTDKWTFNTGLAYYNIASNTDIESGNAYATSIGTAGNNYASVLVANNSAAINSYALTTATSIGTAGNNYASILIANNSAAINSYALTTATSIGTAGNNYATVMDTAGNNYMLATVTAANNWSNTKLANASVTLAGSLTSTSTLNDSKGEIRSVPVNNQTIAYQLVSSDAGKCISITTGGVTVPAAIFAAGDTVVIYNNSVNSQTITQGGSVTMYQVGTATTGNRTLAQRGLATVFCVAANTFVISGGGLT